MPLTIVDFRIANCHLVWWLTKSHLRVRTWPPKKMLKMKIECAGINRQEAEDERSSRGGSSEPLGPEFGAAGRED